MSVGRIGARAALVIVGVLVSVALMSASASAASTTLCVPTGENAPVKTPLKNGTCASTKTEKYTLSELQNKLPLTDAEVKTLQGILPCIASVQKGIDEKPTVQFHGCNVQIVNGEGYTESANGVGNLMIGYDENRISAPQGGSHNFVLGGEDKEFTSFGGIVGGNVNAINAPFASVLGGDHNRASAKFASVIGGRNNTANGEGASVSGGFGNTASGSDASVSGGQQNSASGNLSSITGGFGNTASGRWSSIFGGKELTAENEYEAIP
jgi:hypothetical protein